MIPGRIVALDVGDVRIGIATSDETRLIATPHSVYTRVGFGPDVRHIAALCESLGTRDVLCGLPRNMDGSIGFQAQKVIALADRLREAGLNVFFQDERLTTVTAERALIEGGMHRQERRGTVDKVAAAVILQQYLDTLHSRGPAPAAYRRRRIPMTDEMNPNLPEEEDNIVELTDQDGNVVRFEHLATLPYNGGEYVVLLAVNDEEEESDEGEVEILEIQQDENGEDIFVSVEDDDVAEAVFNLFMEQMDEEDGE